MEARHARHGVLGRVHEVGPRTAMNVDIDESRDDDPFRDVAAGRWMHSIAHVGDLTVIDRDQHAVAQLASDERAAENAPLAHKQILPRTVERPPVTAATFVSRPEIESLAISAIAIASFSWRNS